MSFAPVIPISGYAGWVFLKRTMDKQTEAFNKQTVFQREEAYFRDNIKQIRTADALVDDPRLLRIALTAYGLEADMPNKFFIRKVLEEGTLKTDSLANKLADSRYKEFTNAFGFGNFSVPRTQLSDFADKMLAKYRDQRFQEAVGEQNGDMRLALNAEVELAHLAGSSSSDASKWFSVLGSPRLREVFEKAFGLPSGFATIDIDKQVEMIKEKAKASFGESTVAQFTDSEKMQKLVRNFLIRSEVLASSSGLQSGQIALSLLQQISYQRF